ncbi:MAG: hypothetical protein ACOC9H_02510 [Gemmatimonadota bacterium]
MRSSTTRVAALLALVFAAGVAGGVALERTWLSSDRDRSERSHDDRDRDRDRGDRDGDRAVIERFSDEIGLSEAQEAQIDTLLARYRDRMEGIWRDVRPRYRALVDSVRQQIEAELDSAQVSRYRDLLEKQRHRDGDRDDDDRGREKNGRGGADSGP